MQLSGTTTPHHAHPAAFGTARTLGLLALAAYLLLLGWLTVRPVPVSWTYPANFTPFASVHQAVTIGGLAGARQLAAALLPLAPLGVLLPLAGGGLRTPWLLSFLRTAGGATMLGTAVEILKSWTPGHVLNVDDILLGTISAAAIHLIVMPAARAVLRVRPQAPGQP